MEDTPQVDDSTGDCSQTTATQYFFEADKSISM